MNRVAICFLTRDRTELSRQSIDPLLHNTALYDLFWVDGSDSVEGQNLPLGYPTRGVRHAVRGGPDAAVCFALTWMVERGYDYVGIVENDVLLDPGWFPETFALFERARQYGLEAGLVSARCYVDRVLAQVDDTFALMHNLGYGTFIATRKAAQLWLRHFRTCQSTEIRRLYAQLAGVDISATWAFGAQPCGLVSDFWQSAVLSAHGLACLALTPARCRMIGQDPSLAEQGLTLATAPAWDVAGGYGASSIVAHRFAQRTARIRTGKWAAGGAALHQAHAQDGTQVIYAHQLAGLGAIRDDEWRLVPGMGPFGFRGRQGATICVELCGPIIFLLSGPGGAESAWARIEQPGYHTEPALPATSPQGGVISVLLPAAVSCRPVTLTALDPGVTLHGIVVRESQPSVPFVFDWHALPPAGD